MKTGTGCLFAALAAALMMSCDNNVRMEGTLVLAHEVRTFTPDGDTATYWIVDKTGTLARQYDELTGGVTGFPYMPTSKSSTWGNRTKALPKVTRASGR